MSLQTGPMPAYGNPNPPPSATPPAPTGAAPTAATPLPADSVSSATPLPGQVNSIGLPPNESPEVPSPNADASGSGDASQSAAGAGVAPNAPRYVVSQDANVVKALDTTSGDQISYARATKSYSATDGQSGTVIYGFGNGSFGMQNATQDIQLAVSKNGDTVLSERGQAIPLGKITNPQVLAGLQQFFDPKAVDDFQTAVTTKDLERTSIGAAFPISIVSRLTSVQSQDNAAAGTAAQAAAQPPAPGAAPLAESAANYGSGYGNPYGGAPAPYMPYNQGVNPSMLGPQTPVGYDSNATPAGLPSSGDLSNSI